MSKDIIHIVQGVFCIENGCRFLPERTLFHLRQYVEQPVSPQALSTAAFLKPGQISRRTPCTVSDHSTGRKDVMRIMVILQSDTQLLQIVFAAAATSRFSRLLYGVRF